MPKLILYPGSDEQSELDLAGREILALGRAGSSDVVLTRRMASRTHALIERRNGRFYIRDTDSYNGTFVNNKQVREAQLVHGDEIRIADLMFQFVEFRDGDRSEPGDTLRLQSAPGGDELLEVAHDDLEAAEAETPTDPDFLRPDPSPAPSARDQPARLDKAPPTAAATGAPAPAAAGPRPLVKSAPATVPGAGAEAERRPAPRGARRKLLLALALALALALLLALAAAFALLWSLRSHPDTPAPAPQGSPTPPSP